MAVGRTVAAMQGAYSIASHWSGDFDEAALGRWAREQRTRLGSLDVSLGLVFISPKLFEVADRILDVLRTHAGIPLLMGCSSNSLIAGDQEIEDGSGLVLGLYSLPGATLRAVQFSQDDVEQWENSDFWPSKTGIDPAECNGWLTFLDPFHLDAEGWLRGWNLGYPSIPVLGGLATGVFHEQRTQLYLNDQVFEEGGVAVAIGGRVEIASAISQGCTPIGDTWTITRVDRNLIQQIGNRPAYQVLVDTFQNLSPADQKKSKANLFIGLVVNEYLDEFHRGDFLIRNLLAADPREGTLVVGALPRAGQTIQFQRRDADTATDDITAILQHAQKQLRDRRVYGACLCSCNGRGKGLFGRPNHDSAAVQAAFGPTGLAGFFCNGEIGPVGAKNFLHGYTAALAIFVEKPVAKTTPK